MQRHARYRNPLLHLGLLAAFLMVVLSGCTEIEYETSYFADRSFSPRSSMPRVVDQSELALRHAGYVDIGALLVKGKGARIKITREAARLGADLIYLTFSSNPRTRIVSEEGEGEIIAEREVYYESYFEAKLFRLEPELAVDRGFLFTLAFPANQLDAGNNLITPDMRIYYVKEFLRAGADPNMVRTGDPLIYCAVRYWRRNYENLLPGIVRLLMEAGADPTAPSAGGMSAQEYVDSLVKSLEEMSPAEIPQDRPNFRRAETLKQYKRVRDIFLEFYPAG